MSDKKENKKVKLQEGDIDKAVFKMDSVVGSWFTEDVVMMGAWCLFDKIPDPKQKTIGIDSRTNPPSVRFNPLFINSLSKEYLEAVMASEGFKVLLKHPTTRLRKPKPISNMASTATINQSIMGGIFGEEKDFMFSANAFDMEDGKWFEYYFRELNDNFENAMSKAEVIFGKPEENDEKADSQDGDGEGQYQDYENSGDGMKEYMNPFSTSNQDWEINDLMDADITNMVNEQKGSTRNWGKYSGDAMGDIVVANTPKISYKDIIRRFSNSVVSSKTISSRMKVNRRYDLAQPGKRRIYNSKILFAIDTSMSMSNDDLQEGFSVINSLCKHSEVQYMLFDTEIQQIEKNFRKAKQTFKVLGRGGTDFNAVCEYAEKQRIDGLIIYTDGFAPAPQKPKGTKVLWLLTNKEYNAPVKWGMTAHLDRFENI